MCLVVRETESIITPHIYYCIIYSYMGGQVPIRGDRQTWTVVNLTKTNITWFSGFRSYMWHREKNNPSRKNYDIASSF